MSFQDTCQLLSILQTPTMPINDEYGSYTQGYATLEFLWAISKHTSGWFLAEAQSSPFHFLMADEATNQTLEHHLIIYFSNDGKLPQITRFVDLLSLEHGTTQSTWYLWTCHTACKNVTHIIFSNTRKAGLNPGSALKVKTRNFKCTPRAYTLFTPPPWTWTGVLLLLLLRKYFSLLYELAL